MKNLLPTLLYCSYFKNLIPMRKGKSWKSEHKFHRRQGLKELHGLRQGGQLLSVSTSLSVKQG